MRYFRVNKKKYSSYNKILLIAEIGSNHNNNFQTCKKLIRVAKSAGFDAVKFQLFKAEELVPKKTKGYKVLKKYEINEDWIKKIKNYCKKTKILFACSPFSVDAVNLLIKHDCDIIKIASPEIKNLPLLEKVVKTNKPLIISTGDCSFNEINLAKKILRPKNRFTNAFLHCVSEYPTKNKNLNLNNIKYMYDKLKFYEVGFSDHSLGINASINAVSLGASIIEKHITISRKLKGPDHFFAIEPKECNQMVKAIRELIVSLGNKNKKRLKDENTVYIKIFSSKFLKKGEKINIKNIQFLRSLKNIGVNCKDYKKVIGKTILKPIKKGNEIKFNRLK